MSCLKSLEKVGIVDACLGPILEKNNFDCLAICFYPKFKFHQ